VTCEKHENWHAHCQQCCGEEISALRDELDMLRDQVADLRDEAASVAERQREACAAFIYTWRMGAELCAKHWPVEDAVRAAPLVTENP